MNKRFADLSPAEALQAAIAIERRNTTIYQNLAQTFASYDGKLGEVFASMAEEEVEHRLQLEAYLREHFPGERPTDQADAPTHEVVEAPDLDEPEAFIFDNVTVEQALEMAERAEARAHDFYRDMAQTARDEGLRALCQHMAEVEAGHQETFVRWKKRSRTAPAAPRIPGGIN